MLHNTPVLNLGKQNPHKIGTTSGKNKLSYLSIVLCRAERTFKCGHHKSVLGPVLFDTFICFFDNERASRPIGFVDNTKPESIVSLLRTKLEFIMNLVN